MKRIVLLLLALTSCRCGSSSGDAGAADAAPGQCCYLEHDAGVAACTDGGAVVCNPQMPVPCFVRDGGAIGSIGACP